MRFARRLFTLFFLSVVVSACAYRFGMRERAFPGGYTQIAVPVFKNVSSEPGIEVLFTTAMIEEIEQSRVGRLTPANESQLTLRGKIINIRYVAGGVVKGEGKGNLPHLPQDSVLATEYRILAVVDVELVRISDQKSLWAGRFEGERSYSAPQMTLSTANSVNPLYNQSARYQNIGLMAKDMMSEAHDRMTENF